MKHICYTVALRAERSEGELRYVSKSKFAPIETISANDIRLSDRVPFKKHGPIEDEDGTINGKPKHVLIVIKSKRTAGSGERQNE